MIKNTNEFNQKRNYLNHRELVKFLTHNINLLCYTFSK